MDKTLGGKIKKVLKKFSLKQSFFISSKDLFSLSNSIKIIKKIIISMDDLNFGLF